MSLEFLPNEIWFQCFEYLNGIDIYHAFDRLNHRFSQLISNIPLCFDFCQYSKSIFDQFSNDLFSDDEKKARIYSLKLSNKHTCYQIQIFLSRFSFQEFPQLRSLTFIEMTQHNISQLLSKYRSLSQLTSFHLIDYQNQDHSFIFDLRLIKLHTLTISKVFKNEKFIFDISLLRHLTISECSLNDFSRLLNNADKLKTLTIKYINGSANISKYSLYHSASYLKQLTIDQFACSFQQLKRIFLQTPNLERLVICYTGHQIDVIDADQWKNLIISSLSFLKIFKFRFECQYYMIICNLEMKYRQFQSDFWLKYHQWYTEYSVSNNSILIYTIPYVSDTFTAKSFLKQLENHSNTFINVKHLTIDPMMITQQNQHCFFHVTSLSLKNESEKTKMISIDKTHIEQVKSFVNLNNIKHLEIGNQCQFENSSIFFELIQNMSQLNSLSIDWSMLKPYLYDRDLCTFLSKNIIKFHLLGFSYNLLTDQNDIYYLCETFSNLEHFICSTNEKEVFLFLIKNLVNLLCITADVYSSSESTYLIVWLERETQKLGLTIATDSIVSNYIRLSIWINRERES